MSKSKKKIKQFSISQIREQWEVATNMLFYKQNKELLTNYRKNKKLQKMIHEKTGWKDYTR